MTVNTVSTAAPTMWSAPRSPWTRSVRDHGVLSAQLHRGAVLSSGILYSADYTMELIYETLLKLRTTCRFNGYIHVKGIPGADQELIARVGVSGGPDERESGVCPPPRACGTWLPARPGQDSAPYASDSAGIAAQSLYLEGDRGFRRPMDTGRAGFAGGAALLDPSRAGGCAPRSRLRSGPKIPEVGSRAGARAAWEVWAAGWLKGPGSCGRRMQCIPVKTPRQSASSGSDGQSRPCSAHLPNPSRCVHPVLPLPHPQEPSMALHPGTAGIFRLF